MLFLSELVIINRLFKKRFCNLNSVKSFVLFLFVCLFICLHLFIEKEKGNNLKFKLKKITLIKIMYS
jgi:hypothetical protein